MTEDIKRRKINKFVKKISENTEIIRKYYKKIQKNKEKDRCGFSDNYHLFFKAFKGIESVFHKNKKLPSGNGNAPRIYDMALDYIAMRGKNFDGDSFGNYVKSISLENELQYDELELLPEMMKFCYIELVADSVKRKQETDIAELIASIRNLSDFSVEDLDGISCIDGLLREHSCFDKLDDDSKFLYRKTVNEKAMKNRTSEKKYLEDIILKSGGRDISYGLFRRKKTNYFFVLTLVFSVLFILFSFMVRNLFVILFSSVPLYIISKSAVETVYSRLKKSRFVPSVIPDAENSRNLVATVTLLSDYSAADRVFEKTEHCRLSNYSDGFSYGIIADLPAGKEAFSETDKELCEYIKRKVCLLNKKYGGGFFAAVRKKTYNEESGNYSGKERKRGAVNSFVSALKEKNSELFSVFEGDFNDVKYLTVLDDDTVPEIDSVKRLVGVLEHPMNTPRLNSDGDAVKFGYGAAVPRIGIRLTSSLKTHFTELKGNDSGKELYSNSYFSVFQDLFGEGTFAGKGVINIDAFYDVICGTFPENKILSHDIPEGNLLRCIYVSDAVFYDDIPSDIISFCERGNRWIRGDIQNSLFLKRMIINEKRKRVLNPMGKLGKFKIFNNIIESLFYPFLFLLVCLSAATGIGTLFLSLFFFFFEDIIKLFFSLFRSVDFIKLRYRSSKFSSGTVAFMDKFYSFICLPYIAYGNMKAIIQSLYRMSVSSNLLKWSTSASLGGSDRKFSEYLIRMWPQYIGAVFLFSPFLSVIGILWLSAVPISYCLAKTPKEVPEQISEDECLSDLRNMWKYFDTFVNEENSFLPPDNFQEEPTPVLAKRTSPTNIGLYLVSLLGAYYLNIIDYSEFNCKLKKTTETVKNLKKWNGHLYNWYSTSDCSVLRPAFVSTVDNGNFICSLLTLRNALKKIDGENPSIKDLDEIIENTDFTLLYSQKKSLLSIGFDCESGKLLNSFYDIYASEALLSYYYAVSERQIPIKAWSKLNRYRYIKYGFSCIKSWSGTMFEYFMPVLFMPVISKSFNDEMLCGAFYEQERRNKDELWGNSESCYYAFDKYLSYQYKAFGVQNLALKRGVNRNNVVSPYSSWLILPFFPDKAVKNLKAFKSMGAYGKFGYYDAVDKTLSRTGGENIIIKNYMAHHVGMSFIAGVNYLKNNIIVKDFSDEKRRAFLTLLEEKNVSYDREYTVYPEFSPQKNKIRGRGEEFTALNPDYPSAKIISNGSFSSFLSDSGNGYISFGRTAVTKRNISSEDPMGVFAFFNYENFTLSATFAPEYNNNTEYRTQYECGKMTYEASSKDFESRYSVSVSCENSCEIREYRIKNNTAKTKTGKILFYFEPALSDYTAYNAHPAFSALFLQGERRDDGTIFVCRRARETGDKNEWLAAAVYAKTDSGFRKINAETEFSRYNVLTRGKGVRSISESFNKEFKSEEIPASFCVAVRFPTELRSRGSAEYRFLISYGKSKEEALRGLEKTAAKGFSKTAAALKAKTNAVYERLEVKKMELKLMDLIYSSIFAKRNGMGGKSGYSSGLREDTLWKYGVSLQRPIIVMKVSEKSLKKSVPFINAIVALRTFCTDFYAVICFFEKGRYDRPIYNYIFDRLVSVGGEKYLNDGICLCNMETFEEASVFISAASFYINLDREFKYDVKYPEYISPEIKGVLPVKLEYEYKCGVGGYLTYEGEQAFGIDDKSGVSSRPLWSNILANKKFGTVVQEDSLGFTYAENSGLNKLTPWSNDPITGCRGEKLYAFIDGVAYDVLKNSSSVFLKGRSVYLAEACGVKIKTEVFIPLEKSCKTVIISFENPKKKKICFEYGITPILSETENFSDVRSIAVKNRIIFTNSLNADFSGFGYLASDNGFSLKNGVRTADFKDGKGKTVFALGYEKKYEDAVFASENTNLKISEKELSETVLYYKMKNGIELHTPDEKLNRFFTFLQYQTEASRLNAKCGFYQCGGAVGFRDQLQDALCLAGFCPEILKERISAAANRQFTEGDVLHWWHDIENGDIVTIKGSRTKSSDDLLWLPYAVGCYYERTSDVEFLRQSAPYISGETLSDGEKEKYISVEVSSEADSIYCHSKKAIKRGATSGNHGLLLFGSGDWNDGMTNVGAKGKGESVWGTFFMILTMKKMLPVAAAFGDGSFETFLEEQIRIYTKAIEDNCWEGDRYIRGYYDDGKPLGSDSSEECKIDILPQAFSAIVGGFDEKRVKKALESADEYLVDRDKKTVRLFYPPFCSSEENPGYIKGYAAGVRENGGQYTHAAVWYLSALLKKGYCDKAYEILQYLNPLEHSETPEDVSLYKVEPYVLSGDVYSTGMGGWSFYTGSAAWYFKTVTEKLLGIIFSENKITLSPNLPSSWNGFSVILKYDGTNIEITVKISEKTMLCVDGKPMEYIALDGNDHKVEYFYSKSVLK